MGHITAPGSGGSQSASSALTPLVVNGNATATQNLTPGPSKLTLTQATTITLSGAVAGDEAQYEIFLFQDGSGGHALTLPTVTWLAGSGPAMPQGAGQFLLVNLVTLDGGTTVYGVYSGLTVTGPGSELGYAAITAASFSTASATPVDVTGLTISPTVPAGATVYVGFDGEIFSDTAGNHISVFLMEGATQLNTRASFQPTSTFKGQAMKFEARLQPTAGAHTYKAQMAVSSGGGNGFIAGATTQPSFANAVQH